MRALRIARIGRAAAIGLRRRLRLRACRVGLCRAIVVFGFARGFRAIRRAPPDPDRHIAQRWQQAVGGHGRVDLLDQLRVLRHDLAVEGAIQQQARVERQLQGVHRLAQDRAQRVRPARQAFDVRGRRGGEHAEALPQQVQVEAGARTVARRDVAQHQGFVHLGLVDQRKVAADPGPPRLRGLQRWQRLAEAGQAGLQPEHEARHQVGAVEPQGAQGVQVFGFDAGIARMVREPEQMLFLFVEHRLQQVFQLVRRDVHHVVEDHAHPARQGGFGQSLRQLGAGGWDGWSHAPVRAEP